MTPPTEGVAGIRPLCPFPPVSRYKGQGDPNDTANFTCVRGGNDPAPIPAPESLR